MVRTTSGYDIIGDIHGHAEALVRLLSAMGYRQQDGVFRHPSRKAIFVGDFIDRGPQQRQSVQMAQSMCAAGAALAVMGNHEFNALGWTTLDANGNPYRQHDAKNLKQHAAFLDEIGDGSPEHRNILDWFRSLPLWLDLPGLRVVHACWNRPAQEKLAHCLDSNNCFTHSGLHEALRKGSRAYDAIETLLKGPEQKLPDDMKFDDNDGHPRSHARIKWWDPSARTFKQAAVGVNPDRLPDAPISTEHHYRESKPVFFGHYWLQGAPSLCSHNAACLDYSVAREGCLAAYRWSGETHIQHGHFETVSSNERSDGGKDA